MAESNSDSRPSTSAAASLTWAARSATAAMASSLAPRFETGNLSPGLLLPGPELLGVLTGGPETRLEGDHGVEIDLRATSSQ